MALTFTDVKRINIQKSGGVRWAIVDITFDASYVTGGWAVAPSDLKLSAILGVIPLGPAVAAAGVNYGWDPVNSKILAFKSAGAGAMMQEIAAGDLSTRVARFYVIGS